MQTLIKKKARVAIFTLNKVEFRANKITRDRERNHIMIIKPIHQTKGPICQEDISVLNVYASNNRTVKHA